MQRSSDRRGETDPVAEALRAAGPRPPLPDLDIERLAAPARAAWQVKIARKRRRSRQHKYLAFAAVLLLAVFAVLYRLAPPPVVATVDAYSGSAPEALTVGSAVDLGTVLRTDSTEWLALSLGSHGLRLDAGSELRLDHQAEIELLRGAVYLEASPAPLKVRAGGVDIEHIGTRFEVRLDGGGEVKVRVRDGRVRIGEDRQWTEVARGQQASGSAAGGFSVRDSPVTGDSWQWIRKVVPAFESHGATLESVVTWLAGEAGWEVVIEPELYLDPSGQPAQVSGSIDRLSLEDALSRVLDGSDLRHHFEGDRVIIEER